MRTCLAIVYLRNKKLKIVFFLFEKTNAKQALMNYLRVTPSFKISSFHFLKQRDFELFATFLFES